MNYDVLLSLAIVAAVLVAAVLTRKDAREQGRANPVGTAAIQADVTMLSARVGRMETSIEEIRKDLDGAPTKADIANLGGDIKALTEKISGVGGHVESVDAAVGRIEDLLLGNSPVAQIANGRSRRK
ncbi:MAG: hypothetical protein ACK4SJ_11230 [Sphingorhabdus sp.]